MAEEATIKYVLSEEAYKSFIDELHNITEKIPSKWLVSIFIICLTLSLFNKYIFPNIKLIYNFCKTHFISEKNKKKQFLKKILPGFINAFHIDKIESFSKSYFTGCVPLNFLEVKNDANIYLKTIVWPKGYSEIRGYLNNIKDAYDDFIYLFENDYENTMNDIIEFQIINSYIKIVKIYKSKFRGTTEYDEKEKLCQDYIARCDCTLKNIIYRLNEFIEYLGKLKLEDLDDCLSYRYILQDRDNNTFDCTKYIDLTSDEKINENKIQV